MGSLYSAGSSSRWRLPRTREGFKKRSSLRNSLRTGVKGFDNFFDLMVDLTILMVVVVGKLGAPRSKREGKFYSNPERLTVTSLLSTGILICHCQPPHVTSHCSQTSAEELKARRREQTIYYTYIYPGTEHLTPISSPSLIPPILLIRFELDLFFFLLMHLLSLLVDVSRLLRAREPDIPIRWRSTASCPCMPVARYRLFVRIDRVPRAD